MALPKEGAPQLTFFDVFHYKGAQMKNIFNFFIVFTKKFLKDVYKSYYAGKRNRKQFRLSRLRDRGVE